MDKKESRRVKLTKRILKDSLLELLQEKNIRHITVTELCQKADVNRSTFYAYYESPYDLMISMQNDIVADSIEMLDSFSALPAKKRMLFLLEKHLEYTGAHIREFQAFSSDIGEDFNLPIKVMEIIVGPYLKVRSEKSGLSDDAQQLSTFCIFGTIGIVKEWIRTGQKKSTSMLASEICLHIDKMFDS